MSTQAAYFNLGSHHRPITTANAEAQTWFNRGLIWTFGFNHEEAIRCFEAALALDPDCAMAHWGVAFAIGPNYNKAWEMFDPEERRFALDRAHLAVEAGLQIASSTEVEKLLLRALQARYPTDPQVEDFGPYNNAFVAAMRPVYEQHPEDLDIASLFAEALMGRTPWELWDIKTGEPAEGSSTVEARTVLETAFASDPAAWAHPGLLHLYIHLMEMSPTPELALRHGDRLAVLVPDSGHLIHMATHIDVLCGDYQNVIGRNRLAVLADRDYTDQQGAENFYTVYRIHNLHFEVYGAMFLAQKQTALDGATELQQLLPEPVVAYLPDLFEAFWGIKTHVMVRFGMWQCLLDEPLPANTELFSFTTALQRYGRVVALANLGRHQDAQAEFERFQEAVAAVPESRYMFNNPAASVLGIATEMAQGELQYKNGAIDTGLAHLNNAAELSDNLVYDEPWGWMQPPRHALAALLMEQQRYDEAEAIYRADLGLDHTLPRPCQHPGNLWSLHGLHECLERRNAQTETAYIKQQLDQVLARADVIVGSSCFCRVG